MPAVTTTTTIEALASMSSQDASMGGARQRIRLMRSNMKLSRSSSATATSSEPATRSHSPAPSTSSTLTTTTTKIEALPIGPKRNVAQGVTHRRSGSGLNSGRDGSPLRRQGSVFTGLHLTLVDDEYSSAGDDLSTYVHSKRGHASKNSASFFSSSTAYTASSSNPNLPLTRSFAAGRSSRESQRASPRPKPLSLDEPKRSIDTERTQVLAQLDSNTTTSTSTSDSNPPKTPTPTPTPLTPSFRFLAPAIPEMRALKMKKLAKQLGESVPEELVFGAVKVIAEVPERTSSSSNKEWAGVEVKSRRRSMSSAPAPAATPPTPSKVSKASKGASKWEPPSSWLRGPSESGEREEKARVKDSWMGAWNAEDHDDVMAKLRALKK